MSDFWRGHRHNGLPHALDEQLKDSIRALCDRGDYQRAATYLLKAHGPEVLGFLQARLRSDADGWEVFSMLCEDLWRGLPRFEFRCSPRTWIYVLSRHAELRFRAAPHRAAERNLAVSALAMSLAEPVRTATAAYQRSDVQDRFRELRERLSETDELILLLRVDRMLDWQAIAEVLLSSEHESSAVSVELLAREAARLRKRFQLVKAQLRAWATAEGLIEG